MIDELIQLVRDGFKSIKDHRQYNSTYSLGDLLSAGFAVFSLKDPSLLAFRQQFATRSENLKRIYGIGQIPGDTALREGLDGVDPAALQAQFKPLVDRLRGCGSNLMYFSDKNNTYGSTIQIRSRWQRKHHLEHQTAWQHA